MSTTTRNLSCPWETHFPMKCMDDDFFLIDYLRQSRVVASSIGVNYGESRTTIIAAGIVFDSKPSLSVDLDGIWECIYQSGENVHRGPPFASCSLKWQSSYGYALDRIFARGASPLDECCEDLTGTFASWGELPPVNARVKMAMICYLFRLISVPEFSAPTCISTG